MDDYLDTKQRIMGVKDGDNILVGEGKITFYNQSDLDGIVQGSLIKVLVIRKLDIANYLKEDSKYGIIVEGDFPFNLIGGNA